MKRLLALAFALLPALASAQPVGPLPTSQAPLFGLPAQQGGSSNPFTNIVFTGQALGPTSCTAYSFSAAPTYGFGYNATSLCADVNGVLTHQWGPTYYALSSNSATFQGGLAGDVTIARAAGPVWNHGISGVTKLSLSSTAATFGVPVVAPNSGTPSATVYNFGTANTGMFGGATSGALSASGTNRFVWDTSGAYVNTLFFDIANADVSLSRGAANRLDLASGDSFNVVSGDITVNGTVVGATVAVSANGTLNIAAPAFIRTAPSIASGFGASPSIPNSNGTAAFTINVGTGGTAQNGVITLPAATTGWIVTCVNITNPAISVVSQTAGTTTSATIQNYARTTGLAAAWTASDVLRCTAVAY